MEILKKSENGYNYEIRPSKSDPSQTYIRFVAPNGEIFGNPSELYTQKHNAVEAIESIMKHAAGAGILDFTQSEKSL